MRWEDRERAAALLRSLPALYPTLQFYGIQLEPNMRQRVGCYCNWNGKKFERDEDRDGIPIKRQVAAHRLAPVGRLDEVDRRAAGLPPFVYQLSGESRFRQALCKCTLGGKQAGWAAAEISQWVDCSQEVHVTVGQRA